MSRAANLPPPAQKLCPRVMVRLNSYDNRLVSPQSLFVIEHFGGFFLRARKRLQIGDSSRLRFYEMIIHPTRLQSPGGFRIIPAGT